jgi:succinyl-CoA synthetase alpha subunit
VLGEIGGLEEYDVADYASASGTKPVAAFLVGRTAPAGRKLGHAGALIGSDRETWAAKVEALAAAGATVITALEDVSSVVGAMLG